jgi:hypothetical protein
MSKKLTHRFNGTDNGFGESLTRFLRNHYPKRDFEIEKTDDGVNNWTVRGTQDTINLAHAFAAGWAGLWSQIAHDSERVYRVPRTNHN